MAENFASADQSSSAVEVKDLEFEASAAFLVVKDLPAAANPMVQVVIDSVASFAVVAEIEDLELAKV